MLRKLVFIFFFVSLSVGTYLHTYTLKATYHSVSLGKGRNKLRLAHISDLHTQGLDSLERQMHKVLSEEKPDLIVLTGDIATPQGDSSGYQAVLHGPKAPMGIYFVPGNWEYWKPIQDQKTLLQQNHIMDLTNRVHQINDAIWLVGFDDSEEGHPKLDILESIPTNAVKIGLFHSPQFFDKIAGKIPLNFAGHSHGGQIRLPFLKPSWTPQGTGPYDQGWFEKAGSKLFVSRGIGTSVVPIRLNCAPELAIIDITY